MPQMHVRDLQLSADDLVRLLNALDAKPTSPEAESRRHPRMRYRSRRVLMHVVDMEGQRVTASFRSVARNLSTSGMSVLHGQMLPPAAMVNIRIPVTGGQLSVYAQVAHCRHVRGMVHEIGLRFVSRPVAAAEDLPDERQLTREIAAISLMIRQGDKRAAAAKKLEAAQLHSE